jgi:hypothetical protein
MTPFSTRELALAGTAGGIVLLAFATGWWGADDSGRRAPTGTAAEWALPKPSVSDISGHAKILAQRLPFGAPAERANPIPTEAQAAGPADTPAMQWRIGGIVLSEETPQLILLIRRPGENTIRREVRHPGEQLPDGSIVSAVEPTNVTIDRQGTIVRIKMFAQN